MYSITKDFEFCYGHRVWTQALNKELAVNDQCKCRHLHGHQGKITIKLEADTLENNMVTDFHHLNWFKVWLDQYFDHKMILDANDPLLNVLLKGVWGTLDEYTCWEGHPVQNEYVDAAMFYTPNLRTLLSNDTNLQAHEKEFIEGLCIVNFVPTSESLSKFFFIRIQDRINLMQEAFGQHVKINSVVFQETPKTSASFTA